MPDDRQGFVADKIPFVFQGLGNFSRLLTRRVPCRRPVTLFRGARPPRWRTHETMAPPPPTPPATSPHRHSCVGCIASWRAGSRWLAGAHGSPRWQPRPPDPELEAEMLRRLMVRLGSDNQRAATSVAAAKAEPRSAAAISARTGSPDTTTSIMVSDGWVWPRAGMCCTRLPASPCSAMSSIPRASFRHARSTW